MKSAYHLLLLFCLLCVFTSSCKKTSNKNSDWPANAAEANLAVGIKKDASLAAVFQSINNLGFDIRQMNGFAYNASATQSEVPGLINLFNQRPYVNTGAWKATPYTIYYFAPENSTRIVNSYFNMCTPYQADLLHLVDSLNLVDRLSETKNMYLSVPAGTETYWKNELLSYPFVKWTETFDQTCLSFQHAHVTAAAVPAAGSVNQAIPITLSFLAINGCGSFGNFSETQEGNTKTLTVNAKYEGCVCTQNIRTLETTYNFTPGTAGEHIIRILQPGGEYLTYTIQIQ